MALCASFALLGFPTDDLWHEVFGQDVTLWGPTHLILLTGGQLTIVCILGLLVEGRVARRARGRSGLARGGKVAIAVCGAGGVLAGLTVYQAEFGFGVPQYRLLFEPVLLAFSGALALVMARALAGRGGALGACAFYVVVSAADVAVRRAGARALGAALPDVSGRRAVRRGRLARAAGPP